MGEENQNGRWVLDGAGIMRWEECAAAVDLRGLEVRIAYALHAYANEKEIRTRAVDYAQSHGVSEEQALRDVAAIMRGHDMNFLEQGAVPAMALVEWLRVLA